MARNISAASLEKLATRTGTEPVTLIEVEWAPGYPTITYGDKKVEGISDGRILQVSDFDDVVNISQTGTSQTVSITFDDTDGALQYIFNNCDIHHDRVWIWQWFIGIPLEDKFLIFDGVIESPVIWKESDRTLTITVVTKSEDNEVGFSPEEGQFPNLPDSLVGKAWPLCFGYCPKVPGIVIDDIPYGGSNGKGGSAASSITKDGTGIRDPALDPWLKDANKNQTYCAQLAQLYFTLYLEASFTARKLGELSELDDISKGKGTFSGLAKSYLAQGNKFLLQAQQVKKKISDITNTHSKHIQNEKSEIGITNGSNYPQGTPIKLNINGAIHTGYFLGDVFHITDRLHPAADKYAQVEIGEPGQRILEPIIPRDNFFWADAGIPLKLSIIPGEVVVDNENLPFPVRYVVAATIQVQVLAVYAHRTVDSVKALYPVPPQLYRVIQTFFGSLPVTIVFFPQSLGGLVNPDGSGQGWEDDIWATVNSPIGPNTVTIIRWLIENYTTHTVDDASFNSVASLLAPYPSNFALFDRPNVLKAIADLAYQARCIVYLKNNIFYLKYLAQKETPTNTITEDDIIEQTLQIEYTETEDLTTKYVATWKADYFQTKPFYIVLRYNIKFYGTFEKNHDFFIYNQQQLVEKSAVFWMIRDSMIYKKVIMSVCISKLNIETLDTVTLNFSHPYIANGPIDCIVQKASFNSADYTIALELWVPVRAGQMVEYDFAFPGNLIEELIFPTIADIESGAAGGGPNNFNNNVTLPESGDVNVDRPMTADQNNGGSLHVTTRPLTWGPDPSYFPDSGNIIPDILTRIDTTQVLSLGKKPDGVTKYDLTKPTIQAATVAMPQLVAMYPGKITGGSGDTYTVDVYQQGLDNKATPIKEVKQLQIADDDDIPAGNWVTVIQIIIQTTDQNRKTTSDAKWYMQMPVWISE